MKHKSSFAVKCASSIRMESISNLVKCFVCNVECLAVDKYLGINIARTLTMQMSSILEKCLREIVDVDNEYFCAECVKKIEDYDHLFQLSLQIETELFELHRKKLEETCYLLDAEILEEQPEAMIQLEELKTESDDITSTDVFNETYDEMIVEYLDDFDTQSDVDFAAEKQKDVAHANNEKLCADSLEKKSENVTHKVVGVHKVNTRKATAAAAAAATANKGRTIKKKVKKNMESSKPEQLKGGEFKCTKCSFVGESLSELQEHKTIKHVDEVKRLVCDICGRSYKSKSALCVHLGIHNGRNSHECHICGKSFTQRGALVRHMPLHTGEKPHQCDICGKRFTHYSSFHMHQMVHTNERKKKCPICNFEFRSNSHMNRHMRTHTGEKPFECPICHQAFAQRYNMKTHYNTHQGIHRPQTRNYKCIICFETFPRREKLNKHLRTSHRISDDDIRAIAEHGPDSQISQEIIDRLKANVYTNEEIFIELVENADTAELSTADPLM